MYKSKLTPEQKVEIIEAFKAGKVNRAQLKAQYGIHRKTLEYWLVDYDLRGKDFFLKNRGRSKYSKEFKQMCVQKYLNGKGSLTKVAAQCGVRSRRTLLEWVTMYKANKELVDYDPKWEVYMPSARKKMSPEERLEVVQHCLAKNRNYTETAALFGVSYDQVYSWVRKYLARGTVGLEDHRGHRKRRNPQDEKERLKKENERLRKWLEEQTQLVALLKKSINLERK